MYGEHFLTRKKRSRDGKCGFEIAIKPQSPTRKLDFAVFTLRKTSQPRAIATSKRAAEPLSVQCVAVSADKVELVRASLQSPSYASLFHEEDVALDVIEDNLSEHFSSELYAILAQNIVTYIGGWVVKKILKSTKCDECRFVLCRATPPESEWSMDHRFCFLQLKNRGGLDNLLLLKVQLLVLSRLGNLNVFDLVDFEDRVANTTIGLDNHYFCLIKQHHHFTRLHNQRVHANRIRRKNTKTIFFKGQ
ncbi:hypothetical protein CAPTEDRAFT_200637 [Capitella teleta]|uniref:Uncharacterized protein n=1 Tax=Capitella teleta TaxID=283909 RepID=R7VHN5_CAPTE|nr:hypothetical protein CAPTEDRAFT_200637 [Capitella teleta]|eukprot:ELU18358.1 hypothetical protein CAPTEDRAFT_200637 [Capitella teleta]